MLGSGTAPALWRELPCMSLHEMYSTFMCRIVFSSRRIVIGVAVLIIGSGMFLRTPAVLHWRVMGHVVGERDSVEILLRARLLWRYIAARNVFDT